MNRISNRNTDRPGFDVRYGLLKVAKWGAISLLAAGGLVLGLEGENALLHGGKHFETGAGLEFVDPVTGHDTFISIPGSDAPPRGETGDLLLLGADLFLGSVAITRVTRE